MKERAIIITITYVEAAQGLLAIACLTGFGWAIQVFHAAGVF